MGQEVGATVYDELHTDDESGVPTEKSIYYPLFRRIADEVERRHIGSVLEVGCGTGRLAEMLMARASVQYLGFDFSPVGTRKAVERTGKPNAFFLADALEAASYEGPYEAVVCTEVLEHIDRDLEVIGLWRAGTHCFCTVPNFDYPTHVRHFRHEDEVRERYGRLIEIDMIERVAKPVRAGLTLREYLRKVRWAREQPKKMLGLLGINTFDWYAGWFVFAGRRKR